MQSLEHTYVDWSNYSRSYDEVIHCNPAYRDLLEQARREWRSIPTDSVTRILDLGAGTGNFGLHALEDFPEASLDLVDADLRMLHQARHKTSPGQKVRLLVNGAKEYLEKDGPSYSLILCFHCLYTLPDPKGTLKAMRQRLAPGGSVLLCDLGRVLDVGKWRGIIFGDLVRQRGLPQALQVLWRARDFTSQNQTIAQLQRNGTFWIHSHEEFLSAVEEAGFEVREHRIVFEGDSDLVLATSADEVTGLVN